MARPHKRSMLVYYILACRNLSFIDAAKEHVLAQNNIELYVSICLSKIEMCLIKPEDDKNVKSDSKIKDLLNRIINLDSLMGDVNSAQKLNKHTIARVKTKLENLLKSSTPQSSS